MTPPTAPRNGISARRNVAKAGRTTTYNTPAELVHVALVTGYDLGASSGP